MRLDVLLVGGGLANALLAWRLRQVRPELRLLLLEAGPRPGGNHTWCFHDRDLDAAQRRWLAPLVAHEWPGYDVRFPGLARGLDAPYRALTSSRLATALEAALDGAMRCGAPVGSVDAAGVRLESGERLLARVVVDGRGWQGERGLALGWQKFFGRELELECPHGLVRPMLMDATVPQLDGFRFVYVLPLSRTRLLVEDTRYSDAPTLAEASLRAAVDEYVAGRGWRVRACVREEQGVLPVALGGDLERFLGPEDGVVRVGLRGGLFHPTTGYSLPDAVRLADWVATQPLIDGPRLARAVRARARALWQGRRFFRLLNRMLFRAARPEQRYRVMQRFYGLDANLVGRFYAAELTLVDRLRLVTGRPPVPLGSALACLPERAGSLLAARGTRPA